jgi:hypothetical protein
MALQQIERVSGEQQRVITLTKATIADFNERKNKLKQLYQCFQKNRTILLMKPPTVEHATLLWNLDEQYKESVLEIVECLNEHIQKSARRIKAAERTTKQLEKLKRRVESMEDGPRTKPRAQRTASAFLVSNPFRRSVSVRNSS